MPTRPVEFRAYSEVVERQLPQARENSIDHGLRTKVTVRPAGPITERVLEPTGHNRRERRQVEKCGCRFVFLFLEDGIDDAGRVGQLTFQREPFLRQFGRDVLPCLLVQLEDERALLRAQQGERQLFARKG